MRWIAAICLALSASAQSPTIDWNAVNKETLEHFTKLVQMDTSDPPGDERQAAAYVKQVLEAEGIPVEVYSKLPNRPSIVARIKGSGKKKPILIMGHTDVVNVDPKKWTYPPFSATRKDGYIYGRGTVDDKDNLVASMMTMVMLKRQGVKLDRDVIFLAEAAEEGNSSLGAGFMAEQHYPVIDAEYCLAEGGGVMRRGGKAVTMRIATTEKVPARVRLVAKGTAGHGSVPLEDNAIARISAAVAKAAAWQTPMKMNDTTRSYFERLATISEPDVARRYNNLVNPEQSDAIQKYLRANEPFHYSMLRTSISPTIFQSGYRNNVIPGEAVATLDIRAVPNENLDQFLAELKRVIGDDKVVIDRDPLGREFVAPSRIDTEMFRALEAAQKRLYPTAVALPSMLTGATDMAYMRGRGMQCYGIGPALDEEDGPKGFGAHSDQERILEDELYRFTRFNYEVVRDIAKTQ